MARKIGDNAMQQIDQRIANNPLAQECINNKQPRQLFVEVVKSFVGTKEIGSNQGPEVEMFQKTVGLSQGDKWCMAFMQTCLAYVETKLNVVSPLTASGACMKVWNGTMMEQRVKSLPLAGAIVIWQHQDDKDYGHTGMVLDCDGTTFHAIEGNTADGQDNLNGQIGQGGDGVRFTHRSYDLYNNHSGDLLLLGCLKPF